MMNPWPPAVWWQTPLRILEAMIGGGFDDSYDGAGDHALMVQRTYPPLPLEEWKRGN